MNTVVKYFDLSHNNELLRLHHIKLSEKNILWQANLQKFFVIDHEIADMISRIESVDLDIDNRTEHVAEFSVLLPLFEEVKELKKRQSSVDAVQLTINISHDCNLRCKYCFASFGSYGREEERGIMDLETAKKIPEKFKNQRVSHIMFFGGEPLMNPEVIDVICKGFSVNQDPPPTYGMVTNGTIISDRILETLRDNHIPITVSIDGYQDLHDSLRPFVSGRGSFDIVSKNINKFREFGINVMFEATFTQQHEREGISPLQLIDGLKHKFGINRGTLGFCEGDPADGLAIPFERRAKYSDELTEYFLDQLMNADMPYIDDDWLSMLSSMLNQSQRAHLCPVGEKAFSITPQGAVYPCHQLTVYEDLKLAELDTFELPSSREKAKQLLPLNYKENFGKCESCWLRYRCAGCIASIKQNFGTTLEVPDNFCKSRFRNNFMLLERLIGYQENPELFIKFSEGLKRVIETM